MRATKKCEQLAADPARDRTVRSGTRRFAWGLAVLVVVLAGCRGYGRYDAKEKMLPAMRQSVRQFAGDLERARANLGLLRQAASGDSTLGIVVEEYAQAVARHEEILTENQQILARFEEDLPSYRDVHRILGAALSEHQAARNRYRSLTKAVRYPAVTRRMEAPKGGADSIRARPMRAVPDTSLRARGEPYTEGRYYVAPVFYERLQSAATDITMRQALAERQQRQQQAARLQQGAQENAQLPSATLPDTAATRTP